MKYKPMAILYILMSLLAFSVSGYAVSNANAAGEAPANVIVSDIGLRNQVKIYWDSVNGAVSYEIHRSDSSGGSFELKGTSSASPFQDNDCIIPNQTYYYKLKAVFSDSTKSDFSTEGSGSAQGLSGDLNSDNRVDGKDMIILSRSLNLSSGQTGFSCVSDLDRSGDIAESDITVLNSDFGFEQANSSNDTIAPSVPQITQAERLTPTSNKLDWQASTDNVGVIGYEIFRNGSSIATTGALSYTDDSVPDPQSSVTYSVKAFDAAGNVSNGASATPVDLQDPTAPQNLQAEKVSSTTVDLTWQAGTDNIGVTEYEIFRNGVSITSTTVLSYTDPGLSEQTNTYTYDVKAKDAAGNSSLAATDIVNLVQPVFEANLLITDPETGNEQALSWDSMTNAVSYEIYRSNTADGTYELISTTTATIFQDNNCVIPNTTYYYKLKAVFSDTTTSEFSSEVSGTIAGLTGDLNKDGRVDVKDQVILARSLNLSTGQTGFECQADLDRTGVVDNADFTIFSANFGFDESATPDDTEAPSVPANFQALKASPSSVNLTWSASTDNIGVSGYELFRDGVSITTTTGLSHSDTDLDPQLAYAYTIKAYDAAGNYSTQASATPVDNQAPTIPQNFQAVRTTSTTADLTWGASTDNIAVTGYEIFRDGVSITTTTNLAYSDSGLVASNTYAYMVKAYDSQGNSSNSASASINPAEEPLQANLVITDPGLGNEQNLSWDAVTDAVSYEIYRSNTTDSTYELISTTTATTFQDNSCVIPNTTYYYKLKAVFSDSTTSAFSDEISAMIAGLTGDFNKDGRVDVKDQVILARSLNLSTGQTGFECQADLDRTGIVDNDDFTIFSANFGLDENAIPDDTEAPSVPQNFQAVRTSATLADLTWEASTDNVSVTGYEIFRNSVSVTTTTNLAYSDTGLDAQETYTYTIKAYDAAGNYSTEASASAIDNQAPSAPQSLVAEKASETSVQLTWNASTDNVGILNYEIYKDGVLFGDTTELTVLITALDPESGYTFTVKAKDTSGNVSVGPSVEIHLQGPGFEANLVLSDPGVKDQQDLTWDALTDAVEYQIYRSDTLNGTYEMIATTNATSFQDTNCIIPGIEYFYKLKAVFSDSSTTRYSTIVSSITGGFTGDINKDGRVDVLDQQILARAFNTSSGDPGFECRADFNRDGVIDNNDFVIFSETFGQEEIAPSQRIIPPSTPQNPQAFRSSSTSVPLGNNAGLDPQGTHSYAVTASDGSDNTLNQEASQITSAQSCTGDIVISRMAGPWPITIITTGYNAGAIASLTWRDKEFISDYDHGRQLQSASSFDGLGEAFNPTEAGANESVDGLNPNPSSSELQGCWSTSDTLATQTKMAFWKPVDGQEVSNHILNKQVTIGAHGLDHVIEYLVQYTLPSDESHSHGVFEVLTGYMQPDFSSFWTYDPASGVLSALSAEPAGEQSLPVIFSTSDGSHAMGVYSPDFLPQAEWQSLGYGRFSFLNNPAGSACTKWNTVWRTNDPAIGGVYNFKTYVIVGSLENVQVSMNQLYDILN